MKGRGNGVILKFKPDWKSLVKGSFRNSDPSNSSNPSVTALRPKGRLQKPHSQNLSAKAAGGGGYWGCPSHKVKGHAAVCFFQIYLSAVDTQVAVVPPLSSLLSLILCKNVLFGKGYPPPFANEIFRPLRGYPHHQFRDWGFWNRP